MFTRTKTSHRNQNIWVQLVESYREGGKMKQRVVRHIGTARTKEELTKLKQLALIIQKELLHQKLTQESNSSITKRYAKQLGQLKSIDPKDKVSLAHCEECARQILGIHDIYGYIYEAIGFTNPFVRPDRRVKAAQLLREIVLARIASPMSKRATVELLGTQFGVETKLDHVYQMMDKIEETFCEHIQKQALTAALRLTGEKIKILFYDATTLYFESFTEDELKQNGYSKDGKFNQPQVLLTLFVTEKGFPIGYEIFPGAKFEGHTLKTVVEKLKKRYFVEEIIFVADRGLLSKENIEYLDQNKIHYIVGARIRSLKAKEQQVILDWAKAAKCKGGEKEITYRIDKDKKQKLILSYKADRAKKDQMDREKSIQKLSVRLRRSRNPKQLVSRYGFQKFIAVEGDAKLIIDEDKLMMERDWDGITGVMTNHPDLTNEAILEHYRDLWQVEESFRINKHDLQMRPIYHWTPQRIRAHIAIVFMAFTCIRYLEYRLTLQCLNLSPEKIRQSLLQVQASIIKDKQSNKIYVLPSMINPIAKQIYHFFEIKTPQGVMHLKV
jgi:transposase